MRDIKKAEILIKVYLILIAIGAIVAIDSISYMAKKDREQKEYTKILEQSLTEQIQEKQVYINILERRENERN